MIVLLAAALCQAGEPASVERVPREVMERFADLHGLQAKLVQSADLIVRRGARLVVVKDPIGLVKALREYTAKAPSRHRDAVSAELVGILAEFGVPDIGWKTLRIRFDGPATDNTFRDMDGNLTMRAVFDGKRSGNYRVDSAQVDVQDGPGPFWLYRTESLRNWMAVDYFSEKGTTYWFQGHPVYGPDAAVFSRTQKKEVPSTILDKTGLVREDLTYDDTGTRYRFYGQADSYETGVVLPGTGIEFYAVSGSDEWSLQIHELLSARFNADIDESVFELPIPQGTVIVTRDVQEDPQTDNVQSDISNVLVDRGQTVVPPPARSWLLVLSGVLLLAFAYYLYFIKGKRKGQC